MRLRSLAAIGSAFLTTACGLSPEDAFREASPSRQNLRVTVAGKSGQALSSETGSQQQALGQVAEWYENSVAVAATVNGGLLWVSNLCEAILKYPATSVTGDTAVWGPWTDDNSPDTFKFTITKVGDSFDYVLEGKPKTAAETAFAKIIYGTHTPGLGEKVGHGSFTVDWNASQTLTNKSKEIGTASYTYERKPTFDLSIATVFKQVRDEETSQLIDANYAFNQIHGGDGSLEFVVMKDVQNNGSEQERAAVKTRWRQGGIGRADLSLSGGESQGKVTASQCWDGSAKETYYTDSAGWRTTQGQENSCAFTPAAYSELK